MASDHTPCFQKKDIATLFDNDRWVLEAPPEAIYITIDPNGGGASDFGMAAGCFDQGRLVVSCVFFYFLSRVCVSNGWIPRANLAQEMLAQRVHVVWMVSLVRDVDKCRIEHCCHLVAQHSHEFGESLAFSALGVVHALHLLL